MSSSKTLSIMIVDDHNIVRHGLKQALDRERGIQVVAEADNGRDAVLFAGQYRPDIIIMDVSMPGLNGIESAKRILADNRDTKIIALSVHSEEQYVLSMMRAGARGYLLKTNLFEQLVNAIKTVDKGNIYLCPDITEHVVKSVVSESRKNKNQVVEKLTAREREILQLIAEGEGSQQIATRLYISRKTADTHKRNIMKKIGLDNIPALTKFAIKHGITDLDVG